VHIGPIGPRLLGRLACDAVLQRVLLAPSGAVLDLGREQRTVTPVERRALVARDRGCVVPSCTAPPGWCEAHHVRAWADGGVSDLGNYALVCARHHTEIHLGIWELVILDGVPWTKPPPWVDPDRPLLRNTYRLARDAAAELGHRLRKQQLPLPGVDLPGVDLPGVGEDPDQQQAA
jgi:hypothetical protein